MQDRANVSADFLELMKQEIIEVIKKYIEVDESAIDVRMTNKQNEDGTNGAPALYANIPIVSIKDDVLREKHKETEKKEEQPKEQSEEKKEDIKEEKEEEKSDKKESKVVEKKKKEEKKENKKDEKQEDTKAKETKEENEPKEETVSKD